MASKKQADPETDPRFPYSVHRMLTQLELMGSSPVVWLPDGKGFKIANREEFVAILPQFFRTGKFRSWQRNLNLWGFCCVNKGPSKGEIFHPFFIRGRPELLEHIVRKKTGDSPSSSAAKKPALFQANPVSGLVSFDQNLVGTTTDEASSTEDEDTRSSAGTSTVTSSTSTSQQAQQNNARDVQFQLRLLNEQSINAPIRGHEAAAPALLSTLLGTTKLRNTNTPASHPLQVAPSYTPSPPPGPPSQLPTSFPPPNYDSFVIQQREMLLSLLSVLLAPS
jgi:hypothetical protein